MKKILSVLLLTTAAKAQIDGPQVPEEIGPLVEFMASASGDAKTVALARNKEDCFEDYRSFGQSVTLPFKKQDGKELKVAILTGLSGPKEALNKNFKSTNNELNHNLDSLISTNFSSHDQRQSAITDLCKGRSEYEIIQMASHLGSKLSSIYDYNRPADLKVRPEDQWNALHARSLGSSSSAAGVCRDATLTVSQFLTQCGFNKDQIGIQSYSTINSGHQVVTIRSRDGEQYTINWSELYTTDQQGGINPVSNPGNIFTGLDYHTYDADGKLLDFKRTELGSVLKSVAGGHVNSSDYLPDIIRMEAQFGGLTGNVFKTETALGDKAQGIALSSKNVNDKETFYTSIGAAYVHNTRDVQTGPMTEVTFEQNIIYLQAEVGYSPKFEFDLKENGNLTLRPVLIYSTEMNYSSTKFDNSYHASGSMVDVNHTARLGGQVRYDNERVTLWGEIRNDYVMHTSGNTQLTGDSIGVAKTNTTINAGASLKTQNYVMTLEAQAKTSAFENQYSVSTSVFDRDKNGSASVMYQVYDRGYGVRDDYVMLQGEKHFKFEKIGRVAVGVGAQIPVSDPSRARIQGQIKFTGK